MYGECKLCGKMAHLETHHIIPKVCETIGLDINDSNNLIDICQMCHAKLTPTGLLTKYGMSKMPFTKMRLRFYTQLIISDTNLTAESVMNIFDKCFQTEKGVIK